MMLALLLDLDALLREADAKAVPFAAQARVERTGRTSDRTETFAARLEAGLWRGPAVDEALLAVWRLPWSRLREAWQVRWEAEPAARGERRAVTPGPSMAVEDDDAIVLVLSSGAARMRVSLDPGTLRAMRVESATTVITLHGVRERPDGVSEERR
jgi:hypothetical protein